ncbi:hypothetical protein [Cellulomonas sp. RIT-PI-Y]|uniref:hypothetical protein n=1 Tax=Cellulomonas sp. RIT-PI-Y TaxID=3035297 RepID=UPI003211D03E
MDRWTPRESRGRSQPAAGAELADELLDPPPADVPLDVEPEDDEEPEDDVELDESEPDAPAPVDAVPLPDFAGALLDVEPDRESVR